MTLNTSFSGVIYYACTSTPLYQSAHENLSSFTDSKNMIRGKRLKKRIT